MKEQLMERLHQIDSDRLMARAAVLREYAQDAADSARGCADEAVCQAGRFVTYTTERVNGFGILDWAIFKVCLICFGAWMATLLSKTAQKLKHVFLIGFLATWIYMIWRIFFCDTDA